MARRGRPPKGTELIPSLDGSQQAKLRLALILQTLSGQITVEDAAAQLGIGRSRFFALRDELLQQSLSSLEPKPTGRPPKEEPQSEKVEQLQQEIHALKVDLRASQIREELALLMPHVLKKKPREVKKKDRDEQSGDSKT
jgi:transposase-like protein